MHAAIAERTRRREGTNAAELSDAVLEQANRIVEQLVALDVQYGEVITRTRPETGMALCASIHALARVLGPERRGRRQDDDVARPRRRPPESSERLAVITPVLSAARNAG